MMPSPEYSDAALHFALTGDDLKARVWNYDDLQARFFFTMDALNLSRKGPIPPDRVDEAQAKAAEFRRPAPPYSQDSDAGILAVFGLKRAMIAKGFFFRELVTAKRVEVSFTKSGEWSWESERKNMYHVEIPNPNCENQAIAEAALKALNGNK